MKYGRGQRVDMSIELELAVIDSKEQRIKALRNSPLTF